MITLLHTVNQLFFKEQKEEEKEERKENTITQVKQNELLSYIPLINCPFLGVKE